jgi:hypothetical protein
MVKRVRADIICSGIANSLSLVVFGRVVAGIGGAGANALVSLIILGKAIKRL